MSRSTSQPTLSFDLDGVLIQNPFQKGVTPRIREHIRRSPALSGLAKAEADKQIDQMVRQTWGARMASGDYVNAYNWDEIYTETSRSFGGDDAPDISTLVTSCCQEEGMIALLPHAQSSLEAIKAAGFRLVAATNGYYAYQWPVLEALGIAPLFDAVLTPDVVGYAKPDPRFFASIAGLIAHVGDTLVHDVLGANLAGVNSIWLTSNLPQLLNDLTPQARVKHPSFETFLARALEATLYREYHPEATLKTCLPDAVIGDIAEIPELIQSLKLETAR